MQGHNLYDPFLTNPYGFAPIDEGVSGSALPNGDLHDYSQYTHADFSMADGVDGVDGELDGDEESDEAETADNLRSQSGSADSTKPKGSKKPRITLARGGACVACRWVRFGSVVRLGRIANISQESQTVSRQGVRV